MSKLKELVRVHLQNRHPAGYSSEVAWRGVKYDPKARSSQSCKIKSVVETYRGIKHTETVRVCQ